MDAPEMDAKAKAEAVFRAIIERCWADENFKKKLLEDATAALKAKDMPIPDEIKINVMENSPSVFNFVLPENPKGELSDADLELVAGGTFPSSYQSFGSLPILSPALYMSFSSQRSTFLKSALGGLNFQTTGQQVIVGPYGTISSGFSGGG